jgi:DUF4097 and DUF4098 domain-containing protein YvlB
MRPVLALAAAFACSGCLLDATVEYKFVEQEQKHFATSGRPEVTLSTFDGAIEVRPTDSSDVDVTIEKRGPTKESLDDLVINASQQGNHVTVEVRSKRHQNGGWNFGLSANAKLIVSLPATSDLSARSGDGSIDVERVTGRVDLSSGDGSIRARDLSGDVTVHTGDGSVTLDGTFATLQAGTGDGSVRVRAGAGSSPAGDWAITTGDGSITLEIPDGFNGNLDAHTGDGRVRLEEVTVSNVNGELRRNSLKGQLGSGGRVVKLRTGDGSITIKRS